MSHQLFAGNNQPQANSIQPVNNREERTKPSGGMWTSTYRDGSSDWVDFCREEGLRSPDKGWVLEVNSNSEVLHVDCQEVVDYLIANYSRGLMEIEGLEMHSINWQAVAVDWDAVHFVPFGFVPEFYLWDIESTLWFNWGFTSVSPVEL